MSRQYIQHITLHNNLVCLATANLKHKDHINFYQFLLLLSENVNVNVGPDQSDTHLKKGIYISKY